MSIHSTDTAGPASVTNAQMAVAAIQPGRSPRRRIKQARRHTEKLTRRIEKAVERGSACHARKLSRLLLLSCDAKFVATDEAAARLRSKQRLAPEGQEIISMAATVDVTRAPAATVRVHAVPKKNWPAFRPIHIFEAVDMARQRLVMRALRPFLPVTPDQYATGNGGRNVAVARVAEIVASREQKWVATCDLKDFYPSLDRDWLRQNLPVGEKVVTSTFLVEDDYGRFTWTGHGLWKPVCSEIGLGVASQKGLPQGACSSPMIADYIVGLVLSGIHLPDGVELINYADDFALIGRTRADVEQAVFTLRGAFMRHPSGDLRLTDDGIRRIADGFSFLGYRFRRRRGGPFILPTDDNMQRMRNRIAQYVVSILKGGATRKLKGYLRSWQSSFRHSAGGEFLAWWIIQRIARAFPTISAILRETVADITDRMRAPFLQVGHG